MRAKFYIYRNLNCGGFSAKLRGIVASRFGAVGDDTVVVVPNPKFQVSSAVNEKVRKTRKRQVHAYVVAEELHMVDAIDMPLTLYSCPRLKYNPFTNKHFYADNNINLDTVGYAVFEQESVFLVQYDHVVHKTLNNVLANNSRVVVA